MRFLRGGCLVAVLLIVVALGMIALLIARPARLAGVSEDSLASSLSGELPKEQVVSCRELPGGRDDKSSWSCESGTLGRGGSGIADERTYVLEADEWGCWDARGGGGSPAPGAVDPSGCIGILNYVFD